MGSEPPELRPGHVTQLIEQTLAGHPGAANELLDEVYQVLHGLAERQLVHEHRADELQATSLINEAYLRVFGGTPITFENRRHLFGVFALAMKEVLIDAARRRNAKKRKHTREERSESRIASSVPSELEDVVALDNALPQLSQRDERAGEVVRLKCFAGLTDRQIADITGMSERTVQREWGFARAFLRREIARGQPDER